MTLQMVEIECEKCGAEVRCVVGSAAHRHKRCETCYRRQVEGPTVIVTATLIYDQKPLSGAG